MRQTRALSFSCVWQWRIHRIHHIQYTTYSDERRKRN